MRRTDPGELDGRTFDVVVIGGGITGAAVARDAALRGLSTVVFDKDDLGSGTSSRSGRLIHGGMRYLGHFQFALVRQALREREHMIRIAPHLSLPRPFFLLVHRGYPENLLKLRVGLTFYDLWARSPRERRHRILSRVETTREEPHISTTDLSGTGVFYDFMTDDARLTLDIARSAYEAGAVVVNHAAVTALRAPRGRVEGVEVDDRLSGARSTIFGRQVVVAVGPWADAVARLEDASRTTGPMLRPTKGAHIVFSVDDLPIRHPLFFRFPRDRRLVWAIPTPTGDHVYVGGTDTDHNGSTDEIAADAEDLEFLLAVANHVVPDARVEASHVFGSWAGLRPLVRPDRSLPASAVSREHRLFRTPGGLLIIAGGKLTTARLMGEEVVDATLEASGRDPRRTPSRSLEQPVSGGAIGDGWVEGFRRRATALGLGERQVERLSFRYGTNADRILGLVAAEADLGRPLGSTDAIVAEVRHAVTEDMAMTLTDVMVRRLGLSPWLRDGGLGLLDDVVPEIAGALGWDAARIGAEVDAYRRMVRANRAFASPDDASGGSD